MNRVTFGGLRSITRIITRIHEEYQLLRKTVEKAREPIADREREVVQESKGPEDVYPRMQKRAAGASTLNILLHGRRLGYSNSKKKIHIVRELSYGDGVFLCGALKASDEPLFIHHIVEEGLEMCKSCINLAKKGAW